MIDSAVICVDIGSTWTKGAVFSQSHDRFCLEKRAAVATTTGYLPDGFFAVLHTLMPEYNWRTIEPGQPPVPVYFSSSAKGGLKVAVVGLVPEMSLQIARLAAFSAGARICASFPYRLSRSCIAEIERSQPDILLLCGGTDGGNERYVTENAQAIASSDFAGTVVYAGNNMAVDRVGDILAGRDLVICENLMPDFGRLNTEPVREAIRQVFLARIVSGKGLGEIVSLFGVQPVPTPLAVLNLTDAIGKCLPDWQNFSMIDMGGATTDFYSYTDAWHPESGTIMKGIVEPKLKRTVEGDLGMRVSAESTFLSGEDYLSQMLAESTQEMVALKGYVDQLVLKPSYIPENEKEVMFDRYLAGACVYHALMRHAGTIEEVYTTKGRVWAQSGKDLRQVRRIIGTGGYLAACSRNSDSVIIPKQPLQQNEKVPLLPEKFDYYADPEYILPLLGNLAEKFPLQAALTAVNSLVKMHQNPEVKESFYCEFTQA